MIRKADETRRAKVEGLKGGQGTVELVHFLEEAESYGTGRIFAVSILPPGCSVGYHDHQGDFEVYYILKGTAKVVDNGVEHTMNPGDSMLCKEGDSHSIENIGEGDLEYLALILFTKQKV